MVNVEWKNTGILFNTKELKSYISNKSQGFNIYEVWIVSIFHWKNWYWKLKERENSYPDDEWCLSWRLYKVLSNSLHKLLVQEKAIDVAILS